MVGEGYNSHVRVIFQCTNQRCQELFIATYTHSRNIIGHYDGQEGFQFWYVAPHSAQEADISEIIVEISPSFEEIYNQSLAAETHELTQLIDVGLRKVLEFLIKDYAISNNPDKEEEIRAAFLSSCIKNYVDDPKIKSCAERAAWLGNDETHYIRVWEDKDIVDLKLLIRLTVNWVESSVLTRRYMEDMNSEKGT